jgi:hypothetical protein
LSPAANFLRLLDYNEQPSLSLFFSDGKFSELFNVTMTAHFDRRVKRHVLFRNRQVQICVSGRATNLEASTPHIQGRDSPIFKNYS